jgi:hypothetical protein
MTAKKPTSDEQFEYDGPKTTLDELFDHHGYQVYEAKTTLDELFDHHGYQVYEVLEVDEEEGEDSG